MTKPTGRFPFSVFLGCAVRRVLAAESDRAEAMLQALKDNETFLLPSHLELLAKETAEPHWLTDEERNHQEKAGSVLGPWLAKTVAEHGDPLRGSNELGGMAVEPEHLKGDVDLIAMLAFRYALPRHTSMTSLVPEIVLKHRELMKLETLTAMAEEAEAYLSRSDAFSSRTRIDDESWASFVRDVRTEGREPFKPY